MAAIVAGGALATAMISWVVNGGDRPATATMVTLAFAAAIACAVGGPLISPQTLMLTRFATTGYIATAGATILEHMRR
ncbi:MAG: hypothetical protein GC131_05700 [Alphaproteobacteria bacterium]|nr:hypothetical protein [Alphaproteobacteria bacterium]